MNLDKVRFGIETTIGGFCWLCSFFFVYLAIIASRTQAAMHGPHCQSAWGGAAVIPKEYLPYLALAVIVASYMFGIVADLLTSPIIFKIFRFPGSGMTATDMVFFLQKASPELISEYNARRGRNMVLRVIGLGLIPTALAVLYWLLRSRPGDLATILVPISLLGISILTLLAFKKNYREYVIFRRQAVDKVIAFEGSKY